MNILVVHNIYQQAGGEDQVFTDETALLESRGHRVIRHTVHNDQVNQMAALTLAKRTIWNGSAFHDMLARVRAERADLVHFHNTFPLLSPAVYSAAASAGAAVVQTLHNYRLMCPSAILFRDEKVCEDCVGRAFAWPAIAHACYRGSRPASAVTAAMLAFNNARGTWNKDVDACIALTEFAREKFLRIGLPAERLIVKPNFVSPDPRPGTGGGNFILFAGRLTESKGIGTLLQAWKLLRSPVQLKIIGDGELAIAARQAAALDNRIEYLGRVPLPQVYDLMGQATALVFPSLWYEGLPKTILESFAKATPVIASRLGSMAELITDNRTGILFNPGDPADLAAKIEGAFADHERLSTMRAAARAEFESLYTADRNYRLLMEVYRLALSRRPRPSTTPAEQLSPLPKPAAAGTDVSS